jgi:hypothetical protein
MSRRIHQLGGILIPVGAAAIIAAVTIVGSRKDAHWSDPTNVILLTAGTMCIVFGLLLFFWPERPPKLPKTKTREYAEVILKEAGIWPSRWQRLLHPRTPVGGLPVRVPDSVREQDQAHHEALQELLDELDGNERDLGIVVANDRTFGVMYSNTTLAKNEHVLRYDPHMSELVHDAYQATQALNERTKERYDAASHDDLNNPRWLRLREGERRDVRDALEAVRAAQAAVRGAKEAHP